MHFEQFWNSDISLVFSGAKINVVYSNTGKSPSWNIPRNYFHIFKPPQHKMCLFIPYFCSVLFAKTGTETHLWDRKERPSSFLKPRLHCVCMNPWAGKWPRWRSSSQHDGLGTSLANSQPLHRAHCARLFSTPTMDAETTSATHWDQTFWRQNSSLE